MTDNVKPTGQYSKIHPKQDNMVQIGQYGIYNLTGQNRSKYTICIYNMYKIGQYGSHILPNTPRSFLTRLKTGQIRSKYTICINSDISVQIPEIRNLSSFAQKVTIRYTNNPTIERTIYTQ